MPTKTKKVFLLLGAVTLIVLPYQLLKHSEFYAGLSYSIKVLIGLLFLSLSSLLGYALRKFFRTDQPPQPNNTFWLIVALGIMVLNILCFS